MIKTKYLVIGSGVSGLGFINFINDSNYLILEKESSPGGYCRTTYKNEFIWDYAGHFFHFKNNEIKQFFFEKIDKNDLIYRKKNTKIFYNGYLVDFPFQKNIHQLEKQEFIDCLYDLYFKKNDDNFTTFKEMLFSKFGSSISSKFLIPYNEKLYACDLDNLDKDAMGRFFPYTNFNDVISNFKYRSDESYNQEFFYPKNGAVTFVNVLLEKIDKSKLLFNQKISSIDIDNKILKVNDKVIQYEYLINTAPLPNLMKYISTKFNYENILTFNKVLVFNIGFNKESYINDIHWLYVPDKSINFYRIGFYNNILGHKKLSIYVEIGFKSDQLINIQDELRTTLINLRKINIIDNHEILAYEAKIMSPAYVHVSKESNKIKEEIKNYLTLNQVYSIGRYGDWKYCSIEDSILDSKIIAEKLIVESKR